MDSGFGFWILKLSKNWTDSGFGLPTIILTSNSYFVNFNIWLFFNKPIFCQVSSVISDRLLARPIRNARLPYSAPPGQILSGTEYNYPEVKVACILNLNHHLSDVCVRDLKG